LELLKGLVQQNFGAGTIPRAFVAHEGERFLGTVSIIACDEDRRPHYTPWIAALWVEPEVRQQGIGATLVERATEAAFSTGSGRVYLLSRERRRAFYKGLGWAVLEADELEPGLHVLVRDAEEKTSR
jgi:predicted N-acetyltransferase YhbS